MTARRHVIAWLADGCNGIIPIILLLLLGCRTPVPVSPPEPTLAYVGSPRLYRDQPLRIALLPTVDNTGQPHAARLVHHELERELAATNLFRIITLPPTVPTYTDLTPLDDQLTFLNTMRKEHRLDAVLFSRLADYQPYWPPRIGLAAELVSTSDGNTLLSASGQWDARDSFVIKEFDNYASGSSVANAYDSKQLTMQSPEHFAKFVAHQITAAVLSDKPVPAVTTTLDSSTTALAEDQPVPPFASILPRCRHGRFCRRCH